MRNSVRKANHEEGSISRRRVDVTRRYGQVVSSHKFKIGSLSSDAVMPLRLAEQARNARISHRLTPKDIAMGQAAHQSFFTAADYLAWEAAQLDRHEFLNGEVFAMAGAEDRHVTVAGNLYIALRQHLSGSPCRTYVSDMRLQVAAANCYFYPDVLVTCSALDLASPMVKTEPRLIAEVLSPSTAAYDRGLKFSHYRRIASLEEYVVIDLDSRSTDCFRKRDDGLWVLHPFARGEAVVLASVALELSAAQLFAEVLET